ncbi:UNVERIFIED_CONTAM: hypothetical protein GTU68_032930 [Idotea baltica]|nr:hypothetical protein [Idotea baltica]
MTLVIFIAGIDLSVGSILALGTVICAMLLTQEGWTAASYFGVPATGAVLFVIVFGAAAFLRKNLVSRDQPAGQNKGLGNNIVPLIIAVVIATAAMVWLAGQFLGVIPVPGLFFLGVFIIAYLAARFTTYGSYLLAIGGNEEAARLAGINVNRAKITTYAIAGALSAFAGILYVAQFRQGKPDAGLGLELDAIAAVVIGGTSLMGGRGSIIGTLVGVLIFGFLSNILQLNNIDSNSQLILKGMIIIFAVLIQEGRLEQVSLVIRQMLRPKRNL